MTGVDGVFRGLTYSRGGMRRTPAIGRSIPITVVTLKYGLSTGRCNIASFGLQPVSLFLTVLNPTGLNKTPRAVGVHVDVERKLYNLAYNRCNKAKRILQQSSLTQLSCNSTEPVQYWLMRR